MTTIFVIILSTLGLLYLIKYLYRQWLDTRIVCGYIIDKVHLSGLYLDEQHLIKDDPAIIDYWKSYDEWILRVRGVDARGRAREQDVHVIKFEWERAKTGDFWPAEGCPNEGS